MSTVTLSDTFELRVPDDVRQALKLKAGEQFCVLHFDGRIEFIPIRHPRELRGFASGMDTTIEREDDDRV